MISHTPLSRGAGVLVLAALAAAGCSSDLTQAGGTAPATITLHRTGSAPLVSPALGWAGDLVAGMGMIAPGAVDSLIVTVTRVEVLPWGDRTDDWYSLDVVGGGGGGRIDLMHLPAEPQDGILIGAGDVPAGNYVNARLFVGDATIWFNTPIATAHGDTLRAGTGYPVVIPSADRSGIKTGAGFTIPEGGGEVQLVFDPTATLVRAMVTGNGRVILAPVLRPRHR